MIAWTINYITIIPLGHLKNKLISKHLTNNLKTIMHWLEKAKVKKKNLSITIPSSNPLPYQCLPICILLAIPEGALLFRKSKLNPGVSQEVVFRKSVTLSTYFSSSPLTKYLRTMASILPLQPSSFLSPRLVSLLMCSSHMQPCHLYSNRSELSGSVTVPRAELPDRHLLKLA